MYQAQRLAVIHLGNPKTLGQFYRRIRWHGEGIWERGKGIQWSVTTLSTILHPIAAVAGIGIAVSLLPAQPLVALFVAMLGLIAVPALFVLGRAVQRRRAVPVLGGIALMFITFAARLAGLLRSIRIQRA